MKKWINSLYGQLALLSLLVIALAVVLHLSVMGIFQSTDISMLQRLGMDSKRLLSVASILFTIVKIQGVLCGLLLIIIIARRLVRPVIALDEAAKRVAAGDFTIRLPARKTANELATLTDNFNTMAENLGKVEMLRSGFISDVSHEFKIPLTTISGYARLLRDGCAPEEMDEYADIIMEETIRLSKLVDNILTLNRIERRSVRTQWEAIALDEQVRRALTHFEQAWMSKGIDARFELEEVSIVGYETLLMQVWTNLIDNAIKFTPTGGIIVLSLTRDDDGNGVIFSIRDSGVGIAPGQVDHIFDKFYQADNSRGTEGNGLGLAIVSRIVQIHGGTIRVESSPGEGSVFTVFLKSQPA
jgi:signal transduction histidine kinase